MNTGSVRPSRVVPSVARMVPNWSTRRSLPPGACNAPSISLKTIFLRDVSSVFFYFILFHKLSITNQDYAKDGNSADHSSDSSRESVVHALNYWSQTGKVANDLRTWQRANKIFLIFLSKNTCERVDEGWSDAALLKWILKPDIILVSLRTLASETFQLILKMA